MSDVEAAQEKSELDGLMETWRASAREVDNLTQEARMIRARLSRIEHDLRSEREIETAAWAAVLSAREEMLK